MIGYIKYFFRHNEYGYTNMPLNLIRIVLFLVLVFSFRTKNKEILIKIFLLIGLLFQGLLIIWYLGDKEIFIREGLPLYHCRIAAIMMPVAYFKRKYKLARYFAWMGVIGAFAAFLIPDPSPFLWPHVTNLTYVGSHLTLLLTGSMIILTTKQSLDIRKSLTYTFDMNLVIIVVNLLCGSNYAYLIKLPDRLGLNLPVIVIFFGVSFIIGISIELLDTFSDKVHKERFTKIFVN